MDQGASHVASQAANKPRRFGSGPGGSAGVAVITRSRRICQRRQATNWDLSRVRLPRPSELKLDLTWADSAAMGVSSYDQGGEAWETPQ